MRKSREGAGEPLSAAEELLVEFLAQAEIDDREAFEALCRAHAAHADELRRLREKWARLDRVLGARPERSETKIELTAEQGGAFDEIVARLRRHSPAHGRYVVADELARGGMGVVLKVWDTDLRRHVAMKVLRGRQGGRPESPNERDRLLGRFLEEAQITGQLQHPGIVPVHEIGLDEAQRPYFTMPLVRGRELKEVIELARGEREGWSLTRALAVLLKVCEAVAYAHSKGVVHRDLKPSNVMVGRFGETYVMDWGLARTHGQAPPPPDAERSDPESIVVATDVRDKLASTPDSPLETAQGSVIGTPAYMAPEQALGRLEAIGPRTDVYAIGAMLYHLLTGHMPYVPSGSPVSPQTVLAARLLGPPRSVFELAPQAPPELVAICGKAMAQEPERRYAGALELAADIEAYLGHRPVAAVEPTLGYVVRLALKRNRRVAAVTAAALVLALGFGVRDLLATQAAYRVESGLRADAQVAERHARRLADVAQARLLVREADELHPASPARAPAMRSWLASVDDLASRGAALRAEAQRSPTPELAACVADLDTLARLRPSIAERAERAERQVARTIDERRAQWDDALASIASLPVYRGLRLAPQRGLVPLRLDAGSGLWQFWVDATGDEPPLVGGTLSPAPESALVLALVPGGRATLGLRPDDPARRKGEQQREVELAPFFIGISEVPQSVWVRVMGSNPAEFCDPETCGIDWYTPLLPVECVSWEDCRRFLERVELAFPTEDQWEYAARAGGGLDFGDCDDPSQLEGRENLFDACGASGFVEAGALWCDGYRGTAPAMSFRANAFGLHDTIGNVGEWCSDVVPVATSTAAPAASDRGAPDEAAFYRAFRGSSWYSHEPAYWHLGFRQWDRPNGNNKSRGLRAARPVE